MAFDVRQQNVFIRQTLCVCLVKYNGGHNCWLSNAKEDDRGFKLHDSCKGK